MITARLLSPTAFRTWSRSLSWPSTDRQASVDGEGTKAGAEVPGGLFVEGGELKLVFLEGDAGEIVGKGHGFSGWCPSRANWKFQL